MQYKANLPENQVNASSVLAKGYEAGIVFWPKNPKANFLNGKMNISYAITKHYENARLRGREKTKPNQTQYKPNRTQTCAMGISEAKKCCRLSRGNPDVSGRPKQSQSTRYKIQDTRYKIQDTRYKIRDTRYEILSMNNEQ